MKAFYGIRRGLAMLLALLLVMETLPVGHARADGTAVLDQAQESYYGNVWVNADTSRYQTFTPAIAGTLSRIEIAVFDSFGAPGDIKVSLYKESDQSTAIATAQAAMLGPGWTSVDFGGNAPYLKRGTMYRMVVSTQNGGSSGIGWYLSSSDVYAGGFSAAFGRDFAFRTYMVRDDSLSLTESAIASSSPSLAADGASTATVTVTVKDAQGNVMTGGGATVVIGTDKGTIGPTTDNHDGTYTATLKAPTTLGTATVSAMVNGSALASTASVAFTVGAPSVTTSTIETAEAALVADGVSSTLVTVRLKDAQGHALTTGGATVAIAADKGTVGPTADKGDGTYTATLTAPTTLGTAIVSAKVGNTPLTSTAGVAFTAGAPSVATSTIETADAALVADGVSSTLVTVRLKDAQGHALTTGGSSVAINADKGTVGPTADKGDGTYTATLKAPTALGTATVSAKLGGTALTSTASVAFTVGAPSVAMSTIETTDAALIADGVSTTLVTVRLKDAQGHALTTGGSSVVINADKGTIGPTADKGDGTYTATLKAPTALGSAIVSAKVGGVALTSTASVTFTVGSPSAITSSIEAADAELTADGTSTTTITIKLKDAQGHDLTAGGATVVIGTDKGAIGPTTDNHDGTYTATLTSPTELGSAIVSAKVGGVALTSTANVTFMVGTPSVVASTIEAAVSELTADGTSTTTITVKLKDAQGHDLTAGGATVVIATDKGTVSATTDNHDGTYTATLTAPTNLGIATVSATVGGTALTSTASVTFTVGAPSVTTSTIEAADAELTADGTSTTTITVKLKDAQGHDLTAGGAKVVISTDKGTISVTTDNHDGTYTATLTAPTELGTATISATVGGAALDSTASVTFTAGAPSVTTSTIEAADAELMADGTSTTTITVKLKDAQGHDLTAGGAKVVISTDKGTISATTDNHDGTYTATLTAPTTIGIATVNAAVDGIALTATAEVRFVAGLPTEDGSIEAVDAELTADGTSTTTITVKLKDAQGHDLTTGGAAVAISTDKGTISTTADNQDGTYTATLTAPTELGTATISASVGGAKLKATTEVRFVPGSPSSSSSTVTASDLVVRADGVSKAEIVVTLKDGYEHALPGQRVKLQAQGGSSVTDPEFQLTDENGRAVFTATDAIAEEVTFAAMEETSATALEQTVTIRFAYDVPPVIDFSIDPAEPTFGAVTVTVAASVSGESNRLSALKWAPGSQSLAFFESGGTAFEDRFVVTANGIYSVYAADAAGNANVRTIEIGNIVPLSGDANLSGWQLTGTGGTIAFEFDPGAASQTAKVRPSIRGLKMLLTTANDYSEVFVNGERVDAGEWTGEYALKTGKNKFEVAVQAQDGTSKTYLLTVVRAPAATGGSSPATESPPPANDSFVITINELGVSGTAKRNAGEGGRTTLEVQADTASLKKALEATAAGGTGDFGFSIGEAADSIVLTLPGEAVALLSEKARAIVLNTRDGQYKLPLEELGRIGGQGAQLAIEIGRDAATAGLREAADKEGIRLLSNPVHFRVFSGTEEITGFSRYATSRIDAAADGNPATTVMIWDERLGMRPVPTEFAEAGGRKVAIIRSLANGEFVLVAKPSALVDIQGHWAAEEIRDLNERMIVQGADGGRFVPDAEVTRAELAAMLVRALGLPQGEAGQPSYGDVGESSWYRGAVAAAGRYGVMGGLRDGTFAPEREVTRQEAVVAFVRALKLANPDSLAGESGKKVSLSAYADGGKVEGWAREAFGIALEAGLVNGYGGELLPDKPLTRAETAALLYRLLRIAGFIDG
ncbi:hypothetical protein J19TS2_38790 [Cohnella xylanilytica]|uniref:invasin domain 3-containing protein n=1 Tax=Cohnella xylanilytica TaxID=557555 RepID=UPI001B135C7C|nr:invasin domain 3-containing protein [Cohnella xylanilytica]GIO14324.1 hypothetical protein J19TS2_38790 [Cohnella xylanilytica]